MDLRYNVCTQPRCKNPVPITLESRRCGAHGGETMPIWGVYHDAQGWLTDTSGGSPYSFDVDNAEWFFSSKDAVEAMIAADLVAADAEQIAAECWRRAGSFLVLLLK